VRGVRATLAASGVSRAIVARDSVATVTLRREPESIAFTSPIGENLFTLYDEFIMTLEPLGDADNQPSADIRFSAVIPEGPQPALRALLVSASDAPGRVGYLPGLRMQAGRGSHAAD
jgi:hypothetical protein